MNCESRKDSLLEYALGTLQGPELEELRAHLASGCPACEGHLAEAQALLAILPLAYPPTVAPPGVRDRLMAEINASPGVTSPTRAGGSMRIAPTGPGRRAGAWILPLLAGAAAAACVTVLIYSNILTTQGKTLQDLQSKLNRKDEQLQAMQSTVNDAHDLLQLIEAPEVKVVNLTGQPKVIGNVRLIFDPQSHALRVYASNLKPLPAGKGYELWMFNGPKPIPAGTFVVDSSGNGSMTYAMAGDIGPIGQAALTDEPFNNGKGVAAPTGSIQFVRKLD